jgi:hypothetical protein
MQSARHLQLDWAKGEGNGSRQSNSLLSWTGHRNRGPLASIDALGQSLPRATALKPRRAMPVSNHHGPQRTRGDFLL